jgi:hypothetical protein
VPSSSDVLHDAGTQAALSTSSFWPPHSLDLARPTYNTFGNASNGLSSGCMLWIVVLVPALGQFPRYARKLPLITPQPGQNPLPAGRLERLHTKDNSLTAASRPPPPRTPPPPGSAAPPGLTRLPRRQQAPPSTPPPPLPCSGPSAPAQCRRRTCRRRSAAL